MLRFTQNQERQILASRRAFNRAMETMAANHQDIEGNASQIPLDAWRRIDGRAVQLMRSKMAVFNRLARANTTPVDIADLVNYFPQVSDSGDVTVTMDGRNDGKADQATVKYEGTPVPIFRGNTRIGWREMAVMMRGQRLEIASIANDQRKIVERLENMALNGEPNILVAGTQIYGLRTFPLRNAATTGITLNGATGAQWLAVFAALLNQLLGDNNFGKVTVFMNYGDYRYADVNEFTAGYPKTILQRLKEIDAVGEIIPCSAMPVDELIGIDDIDTSDWGTVLNAMGLTTRPKARLNAEDDYVFGTIAATALQLKSDFDGRCAIAHLTKT
ncbi:major capsid protein [Roseateles sp.]|uniref:major capsid protein n=1 Tax=Roseateles sp. TaxID=1971397 RepID=UPI0031D77BF8